MNRLLLLSPLLLGTGCALVGLTERLNHSTRHGYDAVLYGYSLPSDGPGSLEFELVARDGSGLVERATLELDWWPRPDAWRGAAPPPVVRTSKVLGPLPLCCVPSLPAILGGDFRPESCDEVEVFDGANWRSVGQLPAMVEPPHPARRVLHDALLPLAYVLDALTSPVQVGVFALVLALD